MQISFKYNTDILCNNFHVLQQAVNLAIEYVFRHLWWTNCSNAVLLVLLCGRHDKVQSNAIAHQLDNQVKCCIYSTYLEAERNIHQLAKNPHENAYGC